MQIKNLLIFVGLPGAGKGEAARVAKMMGYRVFSFGNIIREEARKKYHKVDKDSITRIANWFHSGREVLMIKKLNEIIKHTRTSKKFYILDGLRNPPQLSALENICYKCRIVRITLPKTIRYKRQMVRHRADVGTKDDQIARDRRELNYGLDKIFQRAEKTFSNNCPKADFHAKIKKMIYGIEKS